MSKVNGVAIEGEDGDDDEEADGELIESGVGANAPFEVPPIVGLVAGVLPPPAFDMGDLTRAVAAADKAVFEAVGNCRIGAVLLDIEIDGEGDEPPKVGDKGSSTLLSGRGPPYSRGFRIPVMPPPSISGNSHHIELVLLVR